MVEADQLEKENHLVVLDHGANIALLKQGIYEFNADNPMVAVYEGKAQVEQDDRTSGRVDSRRSIPGRRTRN